MIREDGAHTTGLLITGLDEREHFIMDEYEDDDYGEEEGPAVDENGDPIRSPEEIKNIINSIPSFKYEEKKDPQAEKQQNSKQQPGKGSSSAARADDNKESCAICLDDLKTGQMVKAL